MKFEDRLATGKAGESAIAKWLRSRGTSVLPVYEKIIDEGKGPTLFVPSGIVVAPDFVAFSSEGVTWIEAKHKEAFSWYRNGGYWCTGIDRRHYREYLKISELTGCPVWLLFLHRGGQAKDSPAESPKGLFGNDLAFLKDNESHQSDRWGKSGMVYWHINKLKLLEQYENVSRN